MGEYSVYVHITPNGKKYYGLTKASLEFRFGKNGCNYKGCTLFYKAIQKYGWDSIRHKRLIHGLTKEQACRWETRLITYFKTNNPNYGYNLTSGGETNIPSPETIQKLKKSLKGVFAGEKNYFYNRKGADAPNAKSVICLDTKQAFNTVSEAGTFYNVDPSCITNCCKGRTNTIKGLHWLYYKDYTKASEGYIEKILKIPSNNQPNAKKIVCIETNKIYNSISEASRALKIDRKILKKTLERKQNKTHNLHFEYYTD